MSRVQRTVIHVHITKLCTMYIDCVIKNRKDFMEISNLPLFFLDQKGSVDKLALTDK